MDDDYRGRIDSNLVYISNLRADTDDLKSILTDRKKQNSDLYIDAERNREVLEQRSLELTRVRVELQQQQDLSASLNNQKRALEEDVIRIRDYNREESSEIERINVQVDLRQKESVELAARIRAVEFDISKSLGRIDDLTRVFDQKTYDLKAKESTLIEAENELIKLRSQEASYRKELDHQRSLEERYRLENLELQRRIESETIRLSDITAGVKDLEVKIRLREEQILQMRKELEGARYSNSTLLDNNSNLQAEIDAVNNHIRVLQVNNEDLTKELDQFVEANEVIRQRLDRRNRVVELRNKNEVQI